MFYCLATGAGTDIEASVALGVAVVLYFVPINAYRRNYSFEALSDVRRQIRETACIWTIIFAFLASVGFLLKIGPVFSRGATSIFYFVGLGLVLGSRLVVAKYLLLARTSGAFAERKILLIANQEQLTATHRVEDLARFGYRAAKLVPLIKRIWS